MSAELPTHFDGLQFREGVGEIFLADGGLVLAKDVSEDVGVLISSESVGDLRWHIFSDQLEKIPNAFPFPSLEELFAGQTGGHTLALKILFMTAKT